MLRYFVAGNAWLFFGVLTVLGQGVARTSPTYHTFFGQGWISPTTYSTVQAFAFGAGAFLIWRGWGSNAARGKRAASPHDDLGV